MEDPVIDVLIPVYNGARTIESSLTSIRDQSVTRIRIVVVDDGSTDDTPRILERIERQETRLKVIRQPNSGIVAALNNGLAICSAKLIARHDADDLAYRDRFAIQLAYLQANPDCVAVSGSVLHIDEAGTSLGTFGRPVSPAFANPDWAPSIEPYLMHPFLMVRRTALQSAGGYRYVEHAEDTDLYWRLRELGRLHNLSEVLGEYRVHTTSVTGRSVVAGRVGAASAQLAAISAKRRANNKPDINFLRQCEIYRSVSSYKDILEIADQGLTEHEKIYLRVALAGKMLELSSYKPYELEADDCRFIRSNLELHGSILTLSNRKKLARQCAGTAARLILGKRVREATALIPPASYPSTMLRVAFRMIPPTILKLVGVNISR